MQKDGGKIFYTYLYFRNLKFLEASASGPIPAYHIQIPRVSFSCLLTRYVFIK
jgi:hypothetical protein